MSKSSDESIESLEGMAFKNLYLEIATFLSKVELDVYHSVKDELVVESVEEPISEQRGPKSMKLMMIPAVQVKTNVTAADRAANAKLQTKAVAALRTKLAGPPHRRIRQSLIEEYCTRNKETFKSPDFRLFFDCLLNESFIEFVLDTNMFPTTDLKPQDAPHFSPTQLLSTIAERCINLQSLIISHYYPNIKSNHELFSLNSEYALPLSNLKNLTQLDLNWAAPRTVCVSFYTQLGESCPKLKYLKLGPDFPLSVDDLLALILSKRVHLFPGGKNNKSARWLYINGLHRIQISSQHVAPFCHSLEFLGFQHHKDSNLLYEYFDGFLLRHLPKLKTWAVNSMGQNTYNVFYAVQLLHDQLLRPRKPIQHESRTATDGAILSLDWTVDSPPPATLELRVVEKPRNEVPFLREMVSREVNVSSIKAMEAITSMCPNLKQIRFKNFERTITATELKRFLRNKLSQIVYASFWSVDLDYFQAVMIGTGMAERLLKLHLNGPWIEKVDFSELLKPCASLEELVLGETFGYRMSSTDCKDFLPHLKTFEAYCCVYKEVGRLFENNRRPALTTLRLCCSHIGVEDVSDYQWSDFSKLLPNLRELKIVYARGLTADVIQRDIVMALPKLELLTVPTPSSWNSVNKVKADLKERLESSVRLSRKLIVNFADSYYGCIYRPRY